MDESSEMTSFEQTVFEDEDLVCPPAPRLIPVDKSESFKLIPAKSRPGVENGFDDINALRKLARILVDKSPSNFPNAVIEANTPREYLTNSQVAKSGNTPQHTSKNSVILDFIYKNKI